MNKIFVMVAVVAGVLTAASAAHAKKDCWYSPRFGETVCSSSSDSGKDSYTDARKSKPKAVQAMEIWKRRQEIRHKLGGL